MLQRTIAAAKPTSRHGCLWLTQPHTIAAAKVAPLTTNSKWPIMADSAADECCCTGDFADHELGMARQGCLSSRRVPLPRRHRDHEFHMVANGWLSNEALPLPGRYR
jgi:hypothetical protein